MGPALCALPDDAPLWRAVTRLAYTYAKKRTQPPVPERIHVRLQCRCRRCGSLRIVARAWVSCCELHATSGNNVASSHFLV
jgi:hypothetical protein